MTTKCLASAFLLLLFSTVALPAQTNSGGKMNNGSPAVDDVAPDWQLKGSDDKVYRLSEFKDQQAVIMSWYPMALTGG